MPGFLDRLLPENRRGTGSSSDPKYDETLTNEHYSKLGSRWSRSCFGGTVAATEVCPSELSIGFRCLRRDVCYLLCLIYEARHVLGRSEAHQNVRVWPDPRYRSREPCALELLPPRQIQLIDDPAWSRFRIPNGFNPITPALPGSGLPYLGKTTNM